MNKYPLIRKCLVVGLVLLISIFLPLVSSIHPGVNNSNNSINATQSPTKWAVLIGAAGGFTYWHQEIRDRNDIRALKKLLLDYGWENDHIRCFLMEEATKDAILNTSFEWLNTNEADADDIILWYFEGHGYNLSTDVPPIDEPDGKDEIIRPWDPTTHGWNKDKYIVDDELAARFTTLKSNNIVIIIDTCQSGGMIDGSSDLGCSGRVVLTSCAVKESSCMLMVQLHWMFPYYLIQGFKNRADLNHDGFVSAEEALIYTKEPVAYRSTIFYRLFLKQESTQHPQLYDGWPSVENNTEELNLIDL
jgi:Caspase domain